MALAAAWLGRCDGRRAMLPGTADSPLMPPSKAVVRVVRFLATSLSLAPSVSVCLSSVTVALLNGRALCAQKCRLASCQTYMVAHLVRSLVQTGRSTAGMPCAAAAHRVPPGHR